MPFHLADVYVSTFAPFHSRTKERWLLSIYTKLIYDKYENSIIRANVHTARTHAHATEAISNVETYTRTHTHTQQKIATIHH